MMKLRGLKKLNSENLKVKFDKKQIERTPLLRNTKFTYKLNDLYVYNVSLPY